MNRCPALPRMLATLSTIALLSLPAAAPGQGVNRTFTAQALRGELVVTQPPEILLNGLPARLSPGARIRDARNMLVLSAALVDQSLIVHYTLDELGHVRDAWVLTPEERAKRPWPSTPEQAQRWVFDPLTQTWSRP
jgi:hypothetical protein